MKFVFYDDFKPGLLKGERVVDIKDILKDVEAQTPQLLVEGFITSYDELKASLEGALEDREGVPLKTVRLRQPVPKPSLFLCGIGGYKEGEGRMRPLDFFLKGWTSIIGPGDTVVLPPHQASVYNHEAELAVVFCKETKNVSREDAMDNVFGYTIICDVSGRNVPDTRGFWPQKSFDTFGPMGPTLVTKDEILDPHKLDIKLWVNGEIRQNYNTDDMSHDIPEKIRFLSEVCTLSPGDVMACGTNHHGLGPLQDGDVMDIEIERIGRMTINIKDPLKRFWDIAEHTRP
jgi:2-keto-4-pentenoate hydratase/2-oxohepta-3-ene-1,7-dioic acid hydratase in catechol pathway